MVVVSSVRTQLRRKHHSREPVRTHSARAPVRAQLGYPCPRAGSVQYPLHVLGSKRPYRWCGWRCPPHGLGRRALLAHVDLHPHGGDLRGGDPSVELNGRECRAGARDRMPDMIMSLVVVPPATPATWFYNREREGESSGPTVWPSRASDHDATMGWATCLVEWPGGGTYLS